MTAQRDESTAAAEPQRILCVDVLRGFDMFWLVGGTGLFLGIARFLPEPFRTVLSGQLEHVKWEGFRFYDLIFPLFVFVVGMSVVFSLGKLLREKGRAAAYRRIFRRFALMFALGVFYSGGMTNPISEVRWLGVLQRLALCYLFAGLLFCHLEWRGLFGVCVALLLGYWAFLSFVPLPGRDAVSWEAGENWSCYLDSIWLPGRKHDGAWDPEGLLSTAPAVASSLLGVLAALFLMSKKYLPARKCACFIGAGVLLLVLGYAWGIQFPIVKKIWTSSFVLVAGGYSVLLLGLFYLVLDIWQVRWWTTPFIWIGLNPLTIYLLRNVMDFNKLADRFVGGSLAAAAGEDGAYLMRMMASLAFSLLVVWYLNRRKIYLRV